MKNLRKPPFLIAEIVSPPPTIDIKLFVFVFSEIFLAIEIVPSEKFRFSKYIGFNTFIIIPYYNYFIIIF